VCQVAGLGYLFGHKVLPKILNPCAKVASSTTVSYTSKPVISSLPHSLTREVGMLLRLMSRKWYRGHTGWIPSWCFSARLRLRSLSPNFWATTCAA